MITRSIYRGTIITLSFFVAPIFLVIAILGRLFKSKSLTKENINIIWGTTSLTNYKHWSNSLVEAGWKSKSVVGMISYHSFSSDFDNVIFNQLSGDKPKKITTIVNEIYNFIHFFGFMNLVLFGTNLVIHSCEGLVFNHYRGGFFHYKFEYFLLRVAKIRICVIPYGGDAHIYQRIRNPNWLAALLSDYPQNAKRQKTIAEKVDFFVDKADIFLPGSAMLDGFGRSDRISVNTLCVDTKVWCPKQRTHGDSIVISHSPNHRGVKGTESIISAVEFLKAEGHNLELLLIEGKSNEEVRIILQDSSDIHIDQLNSDSYALSAIEAMSLGIPTISSFEGDLREFFDKWSYSKDCPILSASVESVVDVLRTLIVDENLRKNLGHKSRQYVLSYHSYEYFARFFEDVLIDKKIITSQP